MLDRRDYRDFGVFFIYLVLSCLLFGRGLIGHLSDRYIGFGADPSAFMFYLGWWRYVFDHHVNPFITHLQWAPDGANLAWVTFIPLFGIAAIPLTAGLGPIATYNLLVLLCPALAAWTAFILCRYLCSSLSAALVGGYVFGFSPWMLSHLLGHLTVLMIFPVPLMVLVTLRRLDEEISACHFAIVLCVLMVAQFLCWPEAVATATLFGLAAATIAWLSAQAWRERLQALILPFLCACVATAFLLSPYLYYFFAFGRPGFPSSLARTVSVHPMDFLIPTTNSVFGAFTMTRRFCTRNLSHEAGSYLALPILIIAVSFARLRWERWNTRLLINLLAIICICSLGSQLHLWGSLSIPMPWLFFAHLPLIDSAMPARFLVYGFLVLGIIVSLWLIDASTRSSLRLIGAGAVVLFSLPNLNASYWMTQTDAPAFFTDRLYTQYLSPGDNVLILPYGLTGNSNIWQATSDFYFTMAGGYVGPPPFMPGSFRPYYPLVANFYSLGDFPLSGELLKVFLAQKRVNAIVVADEGPHLWAGGRVPRPWYEVEKAATISLFGTLGISPLRVGGVLLYRIPLEKLNSYKDLDPSALEMRIDSMQLDALIIAAANYVSSGRPLSDLNPVEAQRLGLLPHWISGPAISNPTAPVQNRMALTRLDKRDILVGIIGSPEAVRGVADNYRPQARPQIIPLAPVGAFGNSEPWMLLLRYDVAQLPHAAAMVRQREAVHPVTPAPVDLGHRSGRKKLQGSFDDVRDDFDL